MTRTGALFRHAPPALAAGLALACAPPARAASVYTVTATTPDLGIVTSGASGDSVFRIDPGTGSVTEVSGTAVRAGSAPLRAMVTVACQSDSNSASDCSKPVNIKYGVIGSAIGRARALSRLTFTMGTAVLVGPTPPPGSNTFQIAAIGLGQSKTFFIGADFPIAGDDSGLPTGLAEADFFAWASESTPSGGGSGGYRAEILRGLAVAKTSDLAFGVVSKPATGSGSVTIDPASGARTVSGGVVDFPTPAPSRATFSVTGEGGQAISVSVPATFDMTGPQTITVTTTNSVSGTPMLSGTLGSGGSYAFGVGGTAPITSDTPDGHYSGVFTVTVAYN